MTSNGVRTRRSGAQQLIAIGRDDHHLLHAGRASRATKSTICCSSSRARATQLLANGSFLISRFSYQLKNLPLRRLDSTTVSSDLRLKKQHPTITLYGPDAKLLGRGWSFGTFIDNDLQLLIRSRHPGRPSNTIHDQRKLQLSWLIRSQMAPRQQMACPRHCQARRGG